MGPAEAGQQLGAQRFQERLPGRLGFFGGRQGLTQRRFEFVLNEGLGEGR